MKTDESSLAEGPVVRECLNCGHVYPYATEQGASIDLFVFCIACRKDTMSKEELDKICAEAKARGAYS